MLPFRANYLSGRVIGGTLKDGIHPNYVESKVICSCGETFTTHSTLPEIKVEVCAACHPFYTGKQKLVDSGGRVERFNKKYRRTEQAK
jgi:large subunit ribosomal protein L31